MPCIGRPQFTYFSTLAGVFNKKPLKFIQSRILHIMARYGFAFFDSGVRFDSVDAQPGSSMRDLTSFLRNPFDDPKISIGRLIAFVTDHIQRMSANNAGGELTARITATTSAFGLVEDCSTDDQVRLGIRKARKQAKTDFRQQTLPPAVERIEAGLIAAYGSTSTVLIEALPKGRSIFNTCRDDELEMHLETLLTVVTARAADLVPAIVTLAGTVKADWVAIHSASESSTGAKTTTEEGKRLARENLQLMLFLNLLKLAEMFPRQPEKLSLYMQQHLLEIPGSGGDDEEEEPPAPTPPPPLP